MKTFRANHRNFNLMLLVVFFSLFACYTSNAQGLGIGVADPAAALEIKAGTTLIAPLRFTTSGAALLATPKTGAMEVETDALYYTGSTATRRKVSTLSAVETFTGDKTFYGRAMLPMGEVSYFSTTGIAINITATYNGLTGMVVCSPQSTFANEMEFDNGGANTGRLRYIGVNPKAFHVACTVSLAPTNNNGNTFVFGVAKNGTVIPSSRVLQKFGTNSGDTQSTALHVMVALAYNDYLEFYVGNMNNTGDITLKSLCLFALGM